MPSSGGKYDRSPEALEIGAIACSMREFAVYQRPNLDSLLALWICQRIRTRAGYPPVGVLFIPRSATAVGEGIFAVGVGAGRGTRRYGAGWAICRSSILGSAAMACFRALPEDDKVLLEDLVTAISESEEVGENIHSLNLHESLYPDGTSRWDNITLRSQILNTTMWAALENLMEVATDFEVYKTWTNIFDGVLKASTKQRLAQSAAEQTEYRLDGALAILPHNAPSPMTARLAFQNGAHLVLFSSMPSYNKWTLGLSRKPGEESKFINLHNEAERLRSIVPDIPIAAGGHWAGWTPTEPLLGSASDFKVRYVALVQAATEIVRIALHRRDKSG